MPIFPKIVYFIFFSGFCWALGIRILRLFLGDNHFLSPLSKHTLSFAIGNVAISYLLTIIGFLGFFNYFALWLVFLGALFLTIFTIIKKFFYQKKFLPINSNSLTLQYIKKGGKIHLILGTILIALFLIPAFLQSAAPPYMRDSLVYHLLCPKEYLKAGRLMHIEGNFYSSFPKGHEVIMTLLLALGGERAAQGFSVFQNIAAVIALFLIVRLISNSFCAMVCVLGYVTVPPTIYYSGCGYVEPALLMSLATTFLALFSFLKHPTESPNSNHLTYKEFAFIGFLSGWMSAIKYTGLIYLGLIGILLLWKQRKEPANKTFKRIGIFAIFAAPGFTWMIWNWIEFGNPIYPFAYSFFGGKGWDDVRNRAMYLYFQMFGMGKEIWDYILLPWRFSFLGRFDSIYFDGAIGPFLLIFFILSLISAIKRFTWSAQYKILNGIGIVLVISATLFIFGTQQSRFWLPSQLLLCLYGAPALDQITKWASKKHLAKLLLILIFFLSLIWNAWFLGKQMLSIGYYKPILELEKEVSFLQRVVPGFSAIKFINQDVPLSSRVLCVWTGAYGYYLDRPYYSDTLIEDITIKNFIDESSDWEKLKQKLIENGFTHVFIRSSLTEKNMSSRQLAIFKNFMQNGAEEIYRDKDFAVFKILTLPLNAGIKKED